MRLHAKELLSRLNSSYWFVPLLLTLAGVALALSLLLLDGRSDPRGGRFLTRLYPSSPEGARALLSAVIGAMITAISVTFSVTIVALTVAAQHFGPRVLNNFVRHTSAQVVLGTFIATFVYAVLVLGAIRGTTEAGGVPKLAVLGAVSLVVVSIGALIYYVHHVSTALQVGELAAEIARDLTGTAKRLHVGSEGTEPGEPVLEIPAPPEDASWIAARETGYMQRIEYGTLVRLADACKAVIWIRRQPGVFVIAGAPLAFVHPPGAAEEMANAVRDACVVGRDRTLWHDAEFAVKQLVEVALRALSPGVNEPFTAITCIDRLAEGLAAVATAPAPRSCWRGRDGCPRVFAEPQTFATLVRAAFDPIRIFAGPNPAIPARLLDALGELALVATRPADRALLRQEAENIRRATAPSLQDPDDREFVESRYRAAIMQFAAAEWMATREPTTRPPTSTYTEGRR